MARETALPHLMPARPVVPQPVDILVGGGGGAVEGRQLQEMRAEVPPIGRRLLCGSHVPFEMIMSICPRA